MEKMTDREKRAFAAESRMPTAPKCFQCQTNLPIVPFERLKYKYCTIACLQIHMKILETQKPSQEKINNHFI